MENNEHMTNFLKVQGQAMADMEFREKLIQNPKETLSEMGMDIPQDMEIKVVENSSNITYLTLPPVPEEGQLTDEQLEQVAGGNTIATATQATTGTNGTIGTPNTFPCFPG